MASNHYESCSSKISLLAVINLTLASSLLPRNGGEASSINERNESVVDLASKQNCPQLLEVISLFRNQQRAQTPPKTHSGSSSRMSPATTDGYRFSEKA